MIPRDALVEDVEWLLSPMGGREHPEVIARRMGMTVESVARALYRGGRPDLGRQFDRIRKALRVS